MTLVEIFTENHIKNMAACLQLAPEKMIAKTRKKTPRLFHNVTLRRLAFLQTFFSCFSSAFLSSISILISV